MEEKTDETPPVQEPQPTPSTGPKQHRLLRHKKWLWVVAAVAVLAAGAAIIAVNRTGTPARQQAPQNETATNAALAAQVESYEDCQAAEGSVVTDEQCVALDGRTFFMGDQAGNAIDETEVTEAASDTVGDQSVKLCFESCEAGFMNYTQQEPGKSSVDWKVITETSGLDVGTCTLTLAYTPDNPNHSPSQRTLAAVATQTVTFSDGVSVVTVKCPTAQNGTLEATRTATIGDRAPEQCADFAFSAPSQSSAATLSELQQDITGTWEGCVELPWWATYYVSITFNSDGSYNASSTEELDGNISHGGFYDYDIGGAHASKTYGITSYQNGLGQGFIDMVHPSGTVVQRGDLRNIKLSDGKLTFDFYHLRNYGPVRFMVTKQ